MYLKEKSFLLGLPWQKVQRPFVRWFAPKPLHIMFLYVDHFEPWEDTQNPEIAQKRVSNWLEKYPELALKHQDSFGNHPKHTWFYLVENWQNQKYDARFLKQLSMLCFQGLGEIELHIHHGISENSIFSEVNDSESLKRHIETLKNFYNRFGALITAESPPRTAYGFIHGKWALDNSMGGKYCGVNDELRILKETGCYADFTMPSGIQSQSRKINALYYAVDDPVKPKSYNTGISMKKGRKESGDLLMFTGPVDLYWKNIFTKHSIIEKANLDEKDLPFEYRIRRWISTGIHVSGKPEWIFIKVHTHGARETSAAVSYGSWADKMFTYLEKNYRDGEHYQLHYVSAREAYNIAKAAEAGMEGNPEEYRDFVIKPYKNMREKVK